MIKRALRVFKKIIGSQATEAIRPLGHGIKSYLAAAYYGFPASKLTVIGITGTKGKTSTTIYTGRLLNLRGYRTGYISTAVVYDGGEREIDGNSVPFEDQNIYKMTSLDGIVLHRTLNKMVKSGCTHVVIELSSQGMAQNRHWGLGKIDIGLFLNIFPEHLEAHGGWDNYLKAKSILFKNLNNQGVFIAQSNDENAEYMWNAIPDKHKVTKSLLVKGMDYTITQPRNSVGFQLKFGDKIVPHSFDAEFEAKNIAFALRTLETVKRKNINSKDAEAINRILSLPGRMEWVLKSGLLIKNSTFPLPTSLTNVDVLVDYAHEPESMKQLLETLHSWKTTSVYSHVIHILSCDGAGRDDWKKPVMGDVSYFNADFTVLTTDNYTAEDDPKLIVDLLAQNYPKDQEGKKYIREINRLKAFEKALNLATKLKGKSLIVSTGVGSEYGLTQPDGVMPWNEAEEWLKLVEGFVTAKTSNNSSPKVASRRDSNSEPKPPSSPAKKAKSVKSTNLSKKTGDTKVQNTPNSKPKASSKKKPKPAPSQKSK